MVPIIADSRSEFNPFPLAKDGFAARECAANDFLRLEFGDLKMIKAIETSYNGYRFRSSDLPTPPMKVIAKRADYTGKVFERLKVVELLGNEIHGYKWWGCVCDCGNRVAVRSRELAKNHTRSCGCLQAENRESYYRKFGGKNKLPYGHASRNELLASYKKSARLRNFEWVISDEEFFSLVSSSCVYCGSPPNLVRKPNKGVNGEFVYSGIDRVDNKQGYVNGNVVSCCWICNRAKNELPESDFLKWIDQLVVFQQARSARFEHGE